MNMQHGQKKSSTGMDIDNIRDKDIEKQHRHGHAAST
jgi:hypothetical protein